MNDNNKEISIKLTTARLSTDKELKYKGRFVIGYVSWRGITDANLTLKLFLRKNNNLSWEMVKQYTILANKKRFFKRVPPHTSCIDAYLELSGDVKVFELESLKLYVKPIIVGQYD